jgi:acyl phosphate:glycerol-3-phosphate acyltransferase
MEWVWALIGFAMGSLPFSVWIGKYGMKKDIREYGDHNPGTFNVIRAGGIKWGGLALLLDICKGAIPVGLAHYVFHVDGAPLIAAAVAPPLGHAFSPFLNFKGGKAIATTFGTWIGLTLWVVPLMSAVTLVFWTLILTSSAWAVMFTMGCVLLFLAVIAAPPLWFIVWFCHLLIFILKHRRELDHLPRFRFLSHRETA